MRTEDGNVIYECLNGRPEAFGILVDKYKAGIYAFVYAQVRNFHDAQDVTQEVFLQAYRDLHSLKRWESFAFWLYRIAFTRCKKWSRAKLRCPDREFIEDQNPEVLDILALDIYQENQVKESLRGTLDSLPEIFREVLVMHYFGGMTIRDIATATGRSPGAIGMRLSRAREQLKEEIIAMIDTAFEGQKLRASFTFQIMEMIKRVRIQPLSPKILPWSLSLATGLIIAVLGIGTHINMTNTADYTSIPSLLREPKILDVGEITVDVMKVSDTTVISVQELPGDGTSNVAPDLQNALFMAPYAEGGTWTKKTDMPTARECLSASEVNGKIYVIGGSFRNANGWLQDMQVVEEYDPSLDKWTTKASMPTPRSAFSTSVIDGKIYAIGGDAMVPERACAIVEEYDPSLNKWTRKANMSAARSGLSTCAVNGKIYAIGGSRWDAANARLFISSAVEEYDPKSNTWIQKADMPTERAFFGTSSCAVNGLIYVIGGGNGVNGGNMLSLVEEYDPIADKWTKKADMPTARVTSVTSANGKIYAIGGHAGLKVFSTVEEYNPATDSWIKKNDMPTARTTLATCTVNGKIYAIGGSLLQDKLTSVVEEYDPQGESKNIDFKGKLPTTWGDIRTVLNK